MRSPAPSSSTCEILGCTDSVSRCAGSAVVAAESMRSDPRSDPHHPRPLGSKQNATEVCCCRPFTMAAGSTNPPLNESWQTPPPIFVFTSTQPLEPYLIPIRSTRRQRGPGSGVPGQAPQLRPFVCAGSAVRAVRRSPSSSRHDRADERHRTRHAQRRSIPALEVAPNGASALKTLAIDNRASVDDRQSLVYLRFTRRSRGVPI